MSKNKKILFGDNFNGSINDDVVEPEPSESAFFFSSEIVQFSSINNTFDYAN